MLIGITTGIPVVFMAWMARSIVKTMLRERRKRMSGAEGTLRSPCPDCPRKETRGPNTCKYCDA